jgi:hypothetical protein
MPAQYVQFSLAASRVGALAPRADEVPVTVIVGCARVAQAMAGPFTSRRGISAAAAANSLDELIAQSLQRRLKLGKGL